MLTVTPGMAKIFTRRAKKVCKSCGLSIPVYPGRYPQKCPHCSASLDSSEASVIENLVDRLILDEISFGRACDKLDEEFGSAEDVGNQKELTVDKFLQLVVVSGLMDFLLGIKISGESNNIWAFFSDAVKEKTLQEFLRVVREYCTDAALYPSREEGAAWVVSVLNPRVDKNPETSGEIDRAVDVLGSVEVQ